MNKPISFVLAFGSAVGLLGAGCFGGNPNQNSQLANTDAGGGTMSGSLPDGSAPITGVPLATFDTTSLGFAFSTYADPNSTNLGAAASTATPSIGWIGTEGSPSPGALKIVAPYSGANQYVDIQSKAYPMTGLQNWTGGKLHVRIRVDASSTFGGQIEPYADTGAAYNFVGTSFNTGKGSDWQEYVVDLTTAMTQISGFDLSQVILFGIHIGTGAAGSTATPVTFYIDSFSIEGAPGGSTGAGGTSGTGAGGTSGAGGTTGAAGAGGTSGAAGAGGGMPGPSQP